VIRQVVTASFNCSDPSGVSSCLGTAANGADIETSSQGPHTFVVNGTDTRGNVSTASVTYTVIEPPRIVLSSPTKPIYALGSAVFAQYSCVGAGTVTCAGDVASGAPLDTSTPGFKSFTITATDGFGNTAAQIVTYAVSLGACVVPVDIAAWLAGDGNPTDEISASAGTWTGTEAYGAGMVRQAFVFDGNSSMTFAPGQSPAPFTIELWVQTSDRLQPTGTPVLTSSKSGGSLPRWCTAGSAQSSHSTHRLVTTAGR
jgi:hypothetical protein